MNRIAFYLVVATIAALTVCCKSGKAVVANDREAMPFWGEMFTAVCNESDKENICISPLSAQIALGMTATGAEGETEKEIADAVQTGNNYRKYLKGVIVELNKKSEGCEIKSANSIWINEALNVKESFVESNKKYFDAEANRIPFDDSAVGKINGWCDEMTNGKIKRIVERIEPDNRMFLINALYFKAPWSKPFKKEATVKGLFTTEKGEVVKCDMMKQSFNTRYYIDETVQMASKPFRSNYEMLLVLPREDKNIDDATTYLANRYDSCINKMERRQVELRMPKFKSEFGTSLKTTLQELGIKRAFTGKAEFGGISKKPLYIDEVVQKSYICVDEDGAEAAAVTSVTVGLLSARPTKSVHLDLDRPFIYIIRNSNTRDILFIGKVGNPNKN